MCRLFKKHKDSVDIEELFDFSCIPIDELDKQYIDLLVFAVISGYNGKFIVLDGKVLFENAVVTTPVDETIKEIQYKFNLKDWQITKRNADNEIVLLIPNVFKNIRLVKYGMCAYGWSLSYKHLLLKKMMLWTVMVFEPIFDKMSVNMENKTSTLFGS